MVGKGGRVRLREHSAGREGEGGRVWLWDHGAGREGEGVDSGREGGCGSGVAADLHTLDPVSDTGRGGRRQE